MHTTARPSAIGETYRRKCRGDNIIRILAANEYVRLVPAATANAKTGTSFKLVQSTCAAV